MVSSPPHDRKDTVKAYVRRDSQSPHGYTRSSSCNYNCAQIKLRGRGTSRCQRLLGDFVRSEVPIIFGRVRINLSILTMKRVNKKHTLRFQDHHEPM